MSRSSEHEAAGAIDAAELLAHTAVLDHAAAWQVADRIIASDHAREALCGLAELAGGLARSTAILRCVPFEKVIDEVWQVASETSIEIDTGHQEVQ